MIGGIVNSIMEAEKKADEIAAEAAEVSRAELARAEQEAEAVIQKAEKQAAELKAQIISEGREKAAAEYGAAMEKYKKEAAAVAPEGSEKEAQQVARWIVSGDC